MEREIGKTRGGKVGGREGERERERQKEREKRDRDLQWVWQWFYHSQRVCEQGDGEPIVLPAAVSQSTAKQRHQLVPRVELGVLIGMEMDKDGAGGEGRVDILEGGAQLELKLLAVERA